MAQSTPQGLIRSIDPPLQQQLFNFAEAQIEAEVQRHRPCDDLGRKPMALVTDLR